MRVLVTGVNGQLGHDVNNELEKRGYTAIGVSREKMDVTNYRMVEEVVKKSNVDVIVHCAAYTAVDAAEDDPGTCSLVNTKGTENIVKVCKKYDIKLIYISTDYVFNGEGSRPWEPEDKREPLNVYGKTKYEGEIAVEKNLIKYYIVRIAWVFGVNGKNFVKTMLNLSKSKNEVRVVNDQFGAPTYTYDLAKLLVDMAEKDKYGVYHATNEGECSWYEFACEIFRQSNIKMHVLPISSHEFSAKAKRPYNSRMNKEKLVLNGFHKLPSWEDALSRFLKEL